MNTLSMPHTQRRPIEEIDVHTHMSTKPGGFISKDTWIPLGLVLTMIGAAVSFGTVYQKVDALSDSTRETVQSLQETREEVSALRAQREEILRALTDIKSDVNAIRNTQNSGLR